MSKHDRAIIQFDDENSPENTDKCLSPETVGTNPERRNAAWLNEAITTLLNGISSCDGGCSKCPLQFTSANNKTGCKKQLFTETAHFNIS